ncbi:2,4-dienoyl-CoA reductase [Intrasporangium chromatireducens Q5-1]|uniref:Peroxisomal trans-2-enoyl-CoA reductase n=1 Tax=Intrasporangium chromatireducens Q5-1 TaxID=584657 RepID=W9GNH0_9MICO|nr:SDR family oxidoreductase [Intrasporangium chromatireducens]EWT07821.1 2,4-dienoyl-CoA reductase [Intrasporangium chromatireducens Q5-1]
MPYQSIYAPGLFTGQTIIVTGGGSGFGRCAAHELTHLGATVVITGRTRDKLDAVVDEIRADGGSASALVCDIRDEAAVSDTVSRVIEEHGAIHGLVNNAGGQYKSPLRDISTKGFEAVVRNNLTGGFIMMRETVNQWMAEHGGAIVNIVADMWHGWPGMGHSGAARGGMWTLTETAACEWAEYGIRVNALAPGGIASSGFDTYTEQDRAYFREQAVPVIPLRRFGTEAEISAGIVYLLSPAAAYITGSCLRIDGGTPNWRGGWPLCGSDNTEPFRGFHLAKPPSVLEGTGYAP